MPKQQLPRRDFLKSVPLVATGTMAGAAVTGAGAFADEPSLGTIREPARDVPIAYDCDVCVVGGSCTGVFAALAAARLGAKVALTGRVKSKEGVEANVAEIKANGGEAMAVLVDVSNPDEVDAAVQQVADEFGSVDILINNAGVAFGSAVLSENEDKDWNANYGVNVKGTMELCRGVISYMEKAGGGSIVNVASTAGIAASVGMPYPYVATKHGLVGATKVLALEFAWSACRYVKSNAIVLAGKHATVGIGAGQTSRVDAVRVAEMKYGDYLRQNTPPKPLVLASDAFFPFKDAVDLAARCGVGAIIQPGGSIRDEEVIKTADKYGIAMVFTGRRCFKH